MSELSQTEQSIHICCREEQREENNENYKAFCIHANATKKKIVKRFVLHANAIIHYGRDVSFNNSNNFRVATFIHLRTEKILD